MSNASKAQTKRERAFENYRAADTWLDHLLAAYETGEDYLTDGNAVSADAIASEIMGKYRHVVADKNGVSYDGPLWRDIKRAIEAAEKRGGSMINESKNMD